MKTACFTEDTRSKMRCCHNTVALIQNYNPYSDNNIATNQNTMHCVDEPELIVFTPIIS